MRDGQRSDGGSHSRDVISHHHRRARRVRVQQIADWIESAAFEVLLFAVLATGWQQWGSAYKYVLRHYAPLADLVGFTTAPS